MEASYPQFLTLHLMLGTGLKLLIKVTSSSSATGKNDITARIFSPPPTLRLEIFLGKIFKIFLDKIFLNKIFLCKIFLIKGL